MFEVRQCEGPPEIAAIREQPFRRIGAPERVQRRRREYERKRRNRYSGRAANDAPERLLADPMLEYRQQCEHGQHHRGASDRQDRTADGLRPRLRSIRHHQSRLVRGRAAITARTAIRCRPGRRSIGSAGRRAEIPRAHSGHSSAPRRPGSPRGGRGSLPSDRRLRSAQPAESLIPYRPRDLRLEPLKAFR